VLGGTQSLHTNSYDEALALPSEQAVTLALRTQQIIAHETGVASTIDPLGGSYLVEAMTDRLEAQAREYFEAIDALGGMVEAVKRGYPQQQIADAAFALQRRIERGERTVVGVNSYAAGPDHAEIPILHIDEALEAVQIERLRAVRARRDGAAVEGALAVLRETAAGSANLMEPLLAAAAAHASEGEIVAALQSVWGRYRETPVF
jgi:methylmalonyl-CoA mutase N-terminal domain/subunit